MRDIPILASTADKAIIKIEKAVNLGLPVIMPI